MDAKRVNRHLEATRRWALKRLLANTAKELQKCVRAEAGAFTGKVKCVVDGKITTRASPSGMCRCVTCGVQKPWNGAKNLGTDGMDALTIDLTVYFDSADQLVNYEEGQFVNVEGVILDPYENSLDPGNGWRFFTIKTSCAFIID